MPAGTDEVLLRDAARAFATGTFGGRHDFVFALHTDTPRPHVHLAVCSRGREGGRLNPKKADLESWRQSFAQALRERGVEAEATPRRARGVTRKAERGAVRRMRERWEAGHGAPARVPRAAYQSAAKAAFAGDVAPRAWEARTLARQAALRQSYLAQARLLRASSDAADQALGARVAAFVQSMPAPDSQRLRLARELRAGAAPETTPTREPSQGRGREPER